MRDADRFDEHECGGRLVATKHDLAKAGQEQTSTGTRRGRE